MTLSILGIFASLIILMVLAYRGVSVIVLAPLTAMLATIFSGDFPAIVAYTEIFMKAMAGFIALYFPVFLVGAIFGHVMGVSGASTAIANFISAKFGNDRAILAVVCATALLVYGGVSLFVVVFAIYPIGVSIYKKADVPKRLLPASIALGAFTFTMTALPGSPQYINTMPIPYFGTTIYAAPLLGIISSVIMMTLGLLWLTRRAQKLNAAGEGYGVHDADKEIQYNDNTKLPGFVLAIVPILLIFILNFALTNWYFIEFAANYLPAMKALGKSQINGIWPVVISLAVAIVASFILFRAYISSPKKQLEKGALGSLLPIMNTASEVGYGGVIKALAAFSVLQAGIVSMDISPIIKVAISTTLLAGVVGSSSGGTALALEALGESFKTMALEHGISLEAFHRIAIMAAGGLDTLPHSGAVITLLAVTGLSHRQSYKDIAMCTIAIPLFAVAIAIALAMSGIT
ncbi:GntP family permease [Photobacterium kasasachensis]|uniref:GntP family permease n=1 Tax=Photobacterium kasasachensis TaxID=2910240 RepID=UPI003D0F91E3